MSLATIYTTTETSSSTNSWWTTIISPGKTSLTSKICFFVDQAISAFWKYEIVTQTYCKPLEHHHNRLPTVDPRTGFGAERPGPHVLR